MRDSTVFRDLGLYLEREATRLRGLGYTAWASHLLLDADRLLEDAGRMARVEPPLPSAASLAGIDPEFRPAESEIERLRQQLDESEAALHGELTENPRHICPYRAELERLRRREATLRRLYDVSMKCWNDDADETPGHQKDPWVWADWIDAIEEAGAVLEQGEQS